MVNLHEQINAGKLNACIQVVVSSCGDVQGVQRSRNLGLETIVLERQELSTEAFQRGVTDAVAGTDLVCMAGFLSLWRIPEKRSGRVINIHPALLPDFGGAGLYGRRVHEAVLKAGRKESGCSVHFCDNEYDHGPVILQRKVPVLHDDTPDTLAARVFEQECVAYPKAIQLFADRQIKLEGGKIMIA